MKRIVCFLAAALALSVGAAFAAPAALPYQDGIYQDLAPGYGDDVIVTLTVREGRIVALDAKNRNGGESEYFLKARDGLTKAIIEAQGIEGVEAVSGATGTSGSILAAMEGMLLQLRYTGGAGEGMNLSSPSLYEKERSFIFIISINHS